MLSDEIPKRVIDTNDLFQKKMEKIIEEEKKKKNKTSDFVAGIDAERLDADADEIDDESVLGEEEYEEEAEPKIDLEQIQQMADEMLNDAQKRANQIIEEATNDAEQIKNDAKDEGYNEGYSLGNAKANEELEAQKASLLEEDQMRRQNYENEMSHLESMLLDTILKVVNKVFHIQFDDSKEVLLYLVRKTLTSTDGCSEFKIRVNEDNVEYLNEHKEDILQRIGTDCALDIVPDSSLMQNQCLIETENGMFDCGLDVQMDNLIKNLRSLA